MKTRKSLETERKQLEAAVRIVFQRFQEELIDLDETIEELRPIRMRVYQIDCSLRDINSTMNQRDKQN